jgi:hypothetical protein
MTPVDKFHACLYEAEMCAALPGGQEHTRQYLLGARTWLNNNPSVFNDSHRARYNSSAVRCGFKPQYQRLKNEPSFFGEMEYL